MLEMRRKNVSHETKRVAISACLCVDLSLKLIKIEDGMLPIHVMILWKRASLKARLFISASFSREN